MGKFVNHKNIMISPAYQEELDEISEEVKNGNCHTLRQCVGLFEDL